VLAPAKNLVALSLQTRCRLAATLAMKSTRRTNVNTVALIGNLATDVDLKELNEGKKRAAFLLAVNRSGKDGEADFFRITAWDRQAELCERYLAKGQPVGVEGRLRSHSWTDDDGKRRTAIEVNAGRVEFLWRPERKETPSPAEEAAVA
jgi:single-strand DNA-binding protein